MGYADDDDADSIELGSMPPLPRPQAHPTARSPLSVVGSTRSRARKPTRNDETDEDDEELRAAPAPVPHAHPLRGWDPQITNGGARSGVGVGGGAAFAEHLRRPMRSRHVEMQRLDPTFLNRDRIAAYVNKENAQLTQSPTGLEMVPHSTHALQNRIEAVKKMQLEKRPLGEDELKYAATEAAQLRQLGYNGMDPRGVRLIAAQPSPREDAALERARTRKVKKQLDARWLEKRTDPSLRPRGPLEREDELAFYDSVYQVSMQEMLDDGVIFDDQDRRNALEVKLVQWNDLAHDRRGTTGVCGSCFDEWSFH